jgi:predicted chitinase
MRAQKETAAPFDAAVPFRRNLERLQLARDFVERRRKAVADVTHGSNRGNGDESGNQAILDRGRTLVVLD